MKIFGTDGIRGEVNVFPMTIDTVVRVGIAVFRVLLSKHNRKTKVVVGKDTRQSGSLFENIFSSVLSSMGVDVILIGIVPTPAVPMLTTSLGADLGIMISASHNVYSDNGIKFFNKAGYKISEEEQRKIEELLEQDLLDSFVQASDIGVISRYHQLSERYVEHIKSLLPKNFTFKGMKIVLDCANGSSYKIAPTIFRELGATVMPIGVEPNGRNINDNCGSTFIENVQKKVLSEKADVGVSFDGDSDRVIIVNERGDILDGDNILSILATNLKKQGKLKNNQVVSTIMSNTGFEKYLNSIGVDLIRVRVGDKHVSNRMLSDNISLGGEQSGHIIISDYTTTGDGILVGLLTLSFISDSGLLVSDFSNYYKRYTQYNLSLTYEGPRIEVLDSPEIVSYLEKVQESNKDFRLVVRSSGTESKIRIMVEGLDYALSKRLCREIYKYFELFYKKKSFYEI